MTDERPLILLTGATGYVGGRLLKELEARQCRLRCMGRFPDLLRERVSPETEVFQGDVLDKSLLMQALDGVDVAYYLIHFLHTPGRSIAFERQAALNFGQAAAACGVKRIIYLGHLQSSYEQCAPFLQSRQEVGRILRNSSEDIQVIEFRSAPVIGAGSLYFEVIRALVEATPFVLLPRWQRNLIQPIGILDLLEFLLKAVETPVEGSPIFEIGGAQPTTFGELMAEYARQRGLKRYFIYLPFSCQFFCSLLIGLMTPIYRRLARKMMEAASQPTVLRDPLANRFFGVQPAGPRAFISYAIGQEGKDYPDTRWVDTMGSSGQDYRWEGVEFAQTIVDHNKVQVDVTPETAFAPIRRIGGKQGWYAGKWLWHIRGFIDTLLGGVGMKRGRRHPDELRVGDVIDGWRVEAYEKHHHLKLVAELKLPGKVWLEYFVDDHSGKTTVRQTAIFDPVGRVGKWYWYFLQPIRHWVLVRMLRKITKIAKENG